MADKEKRKERIENWTKLMTEWYEKATLKNKSVYFGVVQLLESFADEGNLELGTVHGEFNFHHILIDESGTVWIIDWERISQAYPRFFDLAEYIGRLIVTVEGGIEQADGILKALEGRKMKYSKGTMLFGIYNRILGALWEVSLGNSIPVIEEGDEDVIIRMLKRHLSN